MSRPYFPVQLDDKDIRASLTFKKITNRVLSIGPITIRNIPLSHPKDGGFGFKFEENNKTFVFLTDNELGYVHKGGCTFDDYCEFSKNADLLIHDAEYTRNEYHKILQTSEEPWGHSVVTDVLEMGMKANVKQLGLFHLNAARTDDAVDAIVKEANTILAKGHKNIKCFSVGYTFETTL
jgi:ribonuclease BN (tRNA processing enzyme)